MSHLSPLKIHAIPNWKSILRQNFTKIEDVADFLQLDSTQRIKLLERPKFVLNLPLRLAQKMAKGTLDDPLVKQFLPMEDEAIVQNGFVCDPVGDATFRKESKLLHKYEGRVLLICTSACVMHCRYCFRQNFDYACQDKTFAEELQLIRSDASIHEVILSGGDPLSLGNEVLKPLLNSLANIAHIKRIRFHTRFPVGIPERIDDDFLQMLAEIPKQIYFVIHCNHPHELDEDLFERLHALKRLGCVILNQAVLLKGVNDDVHILVALCEELANHGILPYYLHQLDRVQGAGHFEVPEEEGKALIAEVAKRLSGYAVPKYVREIAGQPNKTPL